MSHQDRISIIITFICGIFVGGYLYLTGFLPTYHLPEAETKDIYDGLVVVVDSYGGCNDTDTCLSFQLLSDRSYRAVLGTRADARMFDGHVSRGVIKNLSASANDLSLAASAEELPEAKCHYGDMGATNFRFLITYEGKNYTLDTCQSDIVYDSPLWEALRAVYREVATAAVG